MSALGGSVGALSAHGGSISLPRRWKKAPKEPARIATAEIAQACRPMSSTRAGVEIGLGSWEDTVRSWVVIGVALEEEDEEARHGVERHGRDRQGDQPRAQVRMRGRDRAKDHAHLTSLLFQRPVHGRRVSRTPRLGRALWRQTAAPRRSVATATSASTTSGSNCVPAHRRSSASASSGLRAGR
jgi:hypothetical protein